MKIDEIKTPVKAIFFGFALFLVLFSLKFIFHSRPPAPQNIISNEHNVQKNETQDLPIKIKIPALSIDTIVEHVGILPDGSMDVPSLPSSTAWYEFGPSPGAIGSAVIDGHAGYKNGVPAVFDYLYKLHIGDKIYVENDSGKTITFTIRKKETYKENANAEKIFNSSDGLAHLNLITCSGIWDKKNKSHSDRLVVFADLDK